MMRLHHIGIEVHNLESIVSYYESLHFQVETCLRLPEEKIVFMTRGQTRIELIQTIPASQSGEIHLAWQVECLGDWIGKNQNNNDYHLLEGPIVLDNGWKTAFFQKIEHSEIIELVQC